MTNNITSLKVSTRFIVGISLAAVALAVMSIPVVTHADTLYRQLEIEMTGSDVSSLQRFLAQDTTIYPQGLVTGYFGTLTKGAVVNFQTKNEIDPVGRVGPITLVAINRQMTGGASGGNSSSNNAPMITNVAVMSNNNMATVNWNTDEVSKASVYYSTTPLVFDERINSVNVSSGSIAMADSNLRTNHSVSLQGLLANTTYYYMAYSTNQIGNVSITWPTSFRTGN